MGVKAFIVRTASTAALKIKKHSPLILTITGISTGVAATVFACKSTLKANTVIEKHRKRLEAVHEAKALVQNGEVPIEEFNEQDYRRDLVAAYVKTGVDWLKLYWLPLSLGALSIVQILVGHRILHNRNLAIVSAYNAVQTAFNKYRQNVKDEYGEEADYNMMTGKTKKQNAEPPKVDGDSDENQLVTQNDPREPSVLARFFDESNPFWKKDPYANKAFLRSRQAELNDLLKMRGHVFLNEAYEALGFEHTSYGAVAGWALTNDGSTSNYIDFGLFNGDSEAVRAFVNGIERSALIDFNVDGIIYDIL